MRPRIATPIALAVVGLFAACGFPGVTYQSESGDGGGDESHVDAPVSAEGSGGDDAQVDGATGDGASEGGDAASSGDGEASTGTDAASDGSDSSTGVETGADGTSDAPGDSGAADSPLDSVADAPVDAPADVNDGGADAPIVCDVDMDTFKAKGGTCGGNDCCDTDNKAHPGQMTYYVQPDACGSFDYNCNGTADPHYPVNLTCGGTGVTGCTGGSGFIGPDPGCGNSGLYGTCVPNGLLACQPGGQIAVTQECR